MNEFDIYHTIRSQISRGVVGAVYDNGPEQMVDLNVRAGQVRTKIPIHQPFGFSSHAPVDGAVTHVISTGADPADLVALPPSNPAAARMGDLNEGETVLYDAAGQRLIFRNGIIAEVDVVNEFIVKVKGTEILKLDNNGLTITGNITASGNIHAGGDVTAKVSLNNHTHGGVQPGGGKTGGPG